MFEIISNNTGSFNLVANNTQGQEDSGMKAWIVTFIVLAGLYGCAYTPHVEVDPNQPGWMYTDGR